MTPFQRVSILLVALSFGIVINGYAAVNIQSGQYVDGEINPVGEVDQFTFTASANETINILAINTGSTGQPHLELYDPNGTRLFKNAFGYQQSSLQGKLSTTGTYSIRVLDYDSNETMPYRLFYERIVPPTSGAVGIASGQYQNGEINPIGEADQYFFTASAGSTSAASARRAFALPSGLR